MLGSVLDACRNDKNTCKNDINTVTEAKFIKLYLGGRIGLKRAVLEKVKV